MADYAAVPLKMIAQGLLTLDTAGNAVVTGQGFSSVAQVGPAQFTFQFDQGVGLADISSGSIVNEPGFGFPDGQVGPDGIDPRFVRAMCTMRAGTIAPGLTVIAIKDVSVVSVPGQGATAITVTLADQNGNFVGGPMGFGVPDATGSGLEVVVWYGNAGAADNFSQQATGPLFQPVLTFP